MPDATTDWLASLLSALRTVPVWLFTGIGIACAAVLFLPTFGSIAPASLAAFRGIWGVWIWVVMETSIILAVARAIEAGITGFYAYRRNVRTRKALVLVPQLHPWWYLAKQQDDTYVSQIDLRIDATNRTDRPVRILNAKLIQPHHRGEVVNAMVMLPAQGTNLHSRMHPVPAHSTTTASVNIMVRGKLGGEGKAIRIGVELTDQAGEKYRVQGIWLSSRNEVPSKLRARARITSAMQRIRKRFIGEKVIPAPAIWTHDGRFDDIDLVLKEEKRNYAANGRSRGGLGSLNVTLHSEPDYGWTTQGSVPALLWDTEHRPPVIDSLNFARLMRLYAARSDDGKRELEDYILSHLDRRSTYAAVAYFIFLGLHRMGRTVDAVTAAQAQLAGDKVFGYSNLLGTLAAVVSREHADINPALYGPLTDLLADDPEHNFLLIEKMNLAHLQHMDAPVG